MGEFNSHNIVWGYKNADPKGGRMEKNMNRNKCFYNDKTYTYLYPSSDIYLPQEI